MRSYLDGQGKSGKRKRMEFTRDKGSRVLQSQLAAIILLYRSLLRPHLKNWVTFGIQTNQGQLSKALGTGNQVLRGAVEKLGGSALRPENPGGRGGDTNDRRATPARKLDVDCDYRKAESDR